MFQYLKGTVESASENLLILENNGIGYKFSVSNNSLVDLNHIGKTVKVFCYMQVSDDGITMYGFSTTEEKEIFEKLITISGVGPKLALSVISGLSLKNLSMAIVSGDVKMLSSIKGVGKKTAERIVLELKEKIEINEFGNINNKVSNQNIMTNELNDAIIALESLGFGRSQAAKAVSIASEKTSKTEEIIGLALKTINSL